MTEANLLPLVFLYTDARESIEGATRFQKLVFISQEETEIVPNIYSYHADAYGPYSPELAGDLEQLEDDNLIEVEWVRNDVGNPKAIYYITDAGISRAKDLLKSEHGSEVFSQIQQIKKRYNDRPISDVVRYVYGKYEEYATKTELDLDRLFDPEASSQFRERESTFVGPGPQEWKMLNPSAEEFFLAE